MQPPPRGVTVTVTYEPDLRGAASAILAVLGDKDAPVPPPPAAPTPQGEGANRAEAYRVLRHLVGDPHPEAYDSWLSERDAPTQGNDEEETV